MNQGSSIKILDYIRELMNLRGMPSYVLFNPGPAVTSARVKAALMKPDLSHRDPDFFALLAQVREKLRQVFRAGPSHEIAILTGSGTAAIEAAITSIIPQGAKALVLVNGAFGERYVQVLETHSMPHEVYNVGWAGQFDLSHVERILDSDPDIEAVVMAHHETSVGLLNPVREIGEIARRHGAILMVDAIASLGAEPLYMERDHIDVCLASSNKALHSVPGLSAVALSPRAVTMMERTRVRTFYLDLRKYLKYMEKDQTPFTPAVTALYALDAALDELLEEGLETRWATYRQRAQLIRSELRRMGLESLTETGRESNTLTMVKLPDYITFDELYARMKSYGYIIYGAKGQFEGKYFQIANMGLLPEKTIRSFLDTLAFVLLSTQRSATGTMDEKRYMFAIKRGH